MHCLYNIFKRSAYFLYRRIKELENLLDRVEQNSKCHTDEISARVLEKNTELSTLRLENDRLKVHTMLLNKYM